MANDNSYLGGRDTGHSWHVLFGGKMIKVYSNGFTYCSVCVPKNMAKDDIVRRVNEENPTGINSLWKISDRLSFRTGQPNPCPCDQEGDTRLHYLMEC